MIKTKEKVTFSRNTWDELLSMDYYREVLEAIEERESLRKAKEKADGFIDIREYDFKRRSRKNV